MKREDEPIETHGVCPHCGGHGCFTLWADGGYYCHQCNAKPEGSTREKREEYMKPTYTEKLEPYRGIKNLAVEFYGITTSYDDKGKDERRVYPYPHKEKYRHLPKDFSKNYGFTTDHLFGMDKFNAGSSKYITIVEGEDDTASAYQMLGHKLPVVGLPSGSVSNKLLKNCHEYLDSFECIVLCIEDDDTGNKAASKISDAFPNKTYRVPLTKHKDANDFLTAGDTDAFVWAWRNTKKKYTPEWVYNTFDQFESIVKDTTGYAMLPTGIEEFDEKVGGLAQSAFTVIQAPEGIGKTELMRMFEHTLLRDFPTVPFGTMHLEEVQKRGLLGLVSYVLDKDVTIQDSEFTEDENGRPKQVFLPSYGGVPEEEVLKVIKDFSDNENFNQFTISMSSDPEDIIDRIRYLATICGCKYVFFEPIQDLAYGGEARDSVEPILRNLSSKLARLAAELNIGIVTIAHENDDGQVRDSRMISKRAHVVVKLSRDKMSDDEDIKNITTLTVIKNRPTSYTGYAGQVKFDPETFTLKEVN